jgi:hypothetical protein
MGEREVPRKEFADVGRPRVVDRDLALGHRLILAGLSTWPAGCRPHQITCSTEI